MSYTQAESQMVIDMAAEGRPWPEIGEAVGRSGDAARKHHSRLVERGEAVPRGTYTENHERCEFSEDEKTARLVLVTGRQIESAEDACRFADVDLKVWRIKKQRIKKYEAHSKNSDDEMQVAELISISVDLDRIISQDEQRAFDYLKKTLDSGWQPAKARRSKNRGTHLLELSLYDHHFAKLCWAPEVSATGDHANNYDTQIASEIYVNAVSDHLDDAAGADIESIMLVVGQDFLNVDNLANTTERGTPQDTDGRVYRTMPMALLSVISAIELAREVAPVEVIWVPGNHGPLTSFCICLALAEKYASNSDVTVDLQPFPRKYRRYGVSLIGSTHGHQGKPKDRANVLIREATALGLYDAEVKFLEWHTGHFHTERQMRSATCEANGIIERVLPSLCGTDKYHADNCYVENRRASMGMLWNKAEGLERIHYSYARHS